MKSLSVTFALLFAVGLSSISLAAEKNDEAAKIEKERFKKFEEMLSGVKLVGRFTILGRDQGKLPEEEYTIKSVKKLPQEDFWKFEARIKYGNNDYTVPLPLRVKWADDTPMITLTDFRILGQGPFSARVIFYNGKYAGTWSHGKAGGHLFGKIVKLKEKDSGQEKSE